MSQDTGDGAWVSAATQRLVILLEAAASESTRQHWTRYLKGAATFRGVPMAGVRSAVATVVRDGDLMSRSEDELLGLSHTWLARQDTEDKLAAVLLLAEHLGTRLRTEHDLQLATPLAKGDVADWNVCDWYATKALHAYLAPHGRADARRGARLAAWSASPNLWRRRAGLVAFVKVAAHRDRQYDRMVDDVLAACTRSLTSADRFAHTGPGWVLRELSLAHPSRVTAFLRDHPHLSAEGRRMASAHLRDGPYRRR